VISRTSELGVQVTFFCSSLCYQVQRSLSAIILQPASRLPGKHGSSLYSFALLPLRYNNYCALHHRSYPTFHPQTSSPLPPLFTLHPRYLHPRHPSPYLLSPLPAVLIFLLENHELTIQPLLQIHTFLPTYYLFHTFKSPSYSANSSTPTILAFPHSARAIETRYFQFGLLFH
jgi:hypothetical protein